MAKITNIITQDIGQVVELMRPLDYTLVNVDGDQSEMPYYIFGRRLEISNRLTEKNLDRVYMFKKYPLVALRLNVPEERNNGVITYNLNIGIFAFTDKETNSEERIEKVFKPILYPMYERFKVALRKSGLFMWEGDQSEPPHTKIDIPFWGLSGSEGNTKYIFSDPLDCIEIQNLQIKQRITNCK